MSRADKHGRHHLHIALTPAQCQRLMAQASSAASPGKPASSG